MENKMINLGGRKTESPPGLGDLGGEKISL